MILPFYSKSSDNPEYGHDKGAPENPFLKIKIILTTIISLILWGNLFCFKLFWIPPAGNVIGAINAKVIKQKFFRRLFIIYLKLPYLGCYY